MNQRFSLFLGVRASSCNPLRFFQISSSPFFLVCGEQKTATYCSLGLINEILIFCNRLYNSPTIMFLCILGICVDLILIPEVISFTVSMIVRPICYTLLGLFSFLLIFIEWHFFSFNSFSHFFFFFTLFVCLI